MKISTKAEYGLRAVIHIAKEKDICPLGHISKEEGIPLNFLEKICGKLRAGGVLLVKRGVTGGYILARPASKITVREILQVLEGDLISGACMGGKASKTKCSHKHNCLAYGVWTKLEGAIAKALDDITIAKLIAKKF